jgi:hypothetical protein
VPPHEFNLCLLRLIQQSQDISIAKIQADIAFDAGVRRDA